MTFFLLVFFPGMICIVYNTPTTFFWTVNTTIISLRAPIFMFILLRVINNFNPGKNICYRYFFSNNKFQKTPHIRLFQYLLFQSKTAQPRKDKQTLVHGRCPEGLNLTNIYFFFFNYPPIWIECFVQSVFSYFIPVTIVTEHWSSDPKFYQKITASEVFRCCYLRSSRSYILAIVQQICDLTNDLDGYCGRANFAVRICFNYDGIFGGKRTFPRNNTENTPPSTENLNLHFTVSSI